MKSLLVTLLIVILLIGSSNGQFVPDKHYIGPCIGLSFLGSTPQFGANYEYGMTLENFGTIGIGGVFRYWSYSEGDYGYTDVLIGAQGNYHFKIDNNKWDPWAGLVLAYDAGSASWDGPSGVIESTPTYGGLFLGLHGGARYWFSPTLAASASIGYGSLSYGALELGVDFKF